MTLCLNQYGDPERTPDTMLLDVVAHADHATGQASVTLSGPVGRRLAAALGLS